MTLATALAGVAGALAAAGLADLAVVVARARVAAASATRERGRAARWVAALTRLGRRIGAPAAPRDLGARLAASGLPATVRTADAMAAKAGGGVVAALATMPLAGALPTRLALVVLPGAAAAGFFAPDLWLARRARRRAARAGLELADVLDLLRVGVEAGLPIGRALEEVGRRRSGLVAAELRALAARLQLGVPRADALRLLQRRLPLPAIAVLTAAVQRADHHGAPLGPALHALAQDARADRARRLHEQAAAAAPRIQLAVALLLVPAVLLFVAAGLVHGLA
ncbi:MAG TPA: type II secretion system F family protein [Baekduia sp.]|uniref:type II secretion system F family protein n=1 Tax=Baekduia sp. TaxID=2600305 RepID=UPI002B9DB95F|nr:type II secretion system F family protein [Baekduia sp.]HMJ34044.1 type II secretion system F family protein [Baekduia sp.]